MQPDLESLVIIAAVAVLAPILADLPRRVPAVGAAMLTVRVFRRSPPYS